MLELLGFMFLCTVFVVWILSLTNWTILEDD